MSSIYDVRAESLSGATVDFEQYRGKTLLIVNTASACGFTPQYKELEGLYQAYRDRGLIVMGFPCNQFGKQEPGNAADIGAFCEKNYGVTFPLFEKVEVNGKQAHPLYLHLKSAAPGIPGTHSIKWNFTKFLIKKDGTVFKRYSPKTPPRQLAGDIEKLLAE